MAEAGGGGEAMAVARAVAACVEPIRWTWRLLAWLSSHRATVVTLAAALAASVTWGPWTAVGLVVAADLVLIAWRLLHLQSFERCVGGPFERSRRRGWYRREWKWWTFGAGLAGTQGAGPVFTSSRQVTGV